MSLANESALSRRGALALVAAPAVAMMTQPTKTHAAAQQFTSTSSSLARPRLAWVVGDSITVLGRSALRERLRRSVGTVAINALSGRPVAELDNLVRATLASGDRPDVIVLALGSNSSRGWRRDDYERVVDAIAASTAVVFVTVYRRSESTPPATLRTMASYSRWMRRIAAERDNVGTAGWRRAASHHPVRLLADGVHPTVRGTRVWAGLIGDAVDRSWRSTAHRL